MAWVHPDADKFVPGSVWNSGTPSSRNFEVLEQRGENGGYCVRIHGGYVVGIDGGWSRPVNPFWYLVKESPRQTEPAMLLLSAFVAAVEVL